MRHGLILLVLAVSNPTSAQADELSIETQLEFLKSAVAEFEKACVKDGALREDIPWCIEERLRLDQDRIRIRQLIETATLPPEPQPQSQTQTQCTPPASPPLDPGSNGDIDAVVDQVLAGNFELSCEKNTEMFSQKCATELTCMAAETVVFGLMEYSARGLSTAAAIAELHSQFKRPYCARDDWGYDTTCVQELLHGVTLDTWSNLRGIAYDLPKMSLAVPGMAWDWLTAPSDNKSLKEWFADKATFMQRLLPGLMDAIDEGIRTSYGCEAWEGVPYQSLCKKPMQAWGCATCSQRIKATCGIIGYLGGEVVSSYLIAGSAAVVKTITASAAKPAGKVIAARIAEIAAQNPRLADAATKAGAQVGRAAVYSVEALKKSYAAVENTLSRIKHSDAVSKALSLQAVKIPIHAAKVVVYPLNQYFELINQAALLGWKHGNSWQPMLRTSKGLIALEGAVAPGASISIDPGTAEALGNIRSIVIAENRVVDFHLSSDGRKLIVDRIRPLN